MKQTYYFQVLFQVKISKLQGESKLKISVLQTFYLYTVPYSNGDSQTFLSTLKTQNKNAHQRHLAHQQNSLISSNSLFCSNLLISNTPLISSTRDKLCANPLGKLLPSALYFSFQVFSKLCKLTSGKFMSGKFQSEIKQTKQNKTKKNFFKCYKLLSTQKFRSVQTLC